MDWDYQLPASLWEVLSSNLCSASDLEKMEIEGQNCPDGAVNQRRVTLKFFERVINA